MVTHDLAGICQKIEHIRKQLDVTLLDRTFLGRRSRPARHGITDNIVIDTLEIRRTVTVEIRHELLADKICIPQGFTIQADIQTELLFQIGYQRTDISLAVTANRSTQSGIDNLATGFSCRSASRQEKSVSNMPVVMQNQFRPPFSERRNQLAHEFRWADTCHVLQAQNEFTDNRFFRQARNLGHHGDNGFRDLEVMVDIKPLGIGKRQGRFENLVLAIHDNFRNRKHIGRFIQEIEAPNHVIMIADHLARQAHEVSWLRTVTEHIGRTDQQLFQGFRCESVPLTRFPERISHVGKHGHMEMSAPAIFNGKQTEIIQIRSDQPVFSQTHAITVVRLGHVACCGIRKMDFSAVTYIIKQCTTVATRIRRRLTLGLRSNFRQYRLETAQ